jgi:hypothetical protein
LLSPLRAAAHSGGVAVAYPTAPVGVVVADSSFTFAWTDSDMRSGTSTPTIDWFYTGALPPTFALGTVPDDLEGTPIALGVPETDLTNELVWSTSSVAPGAYWIWSLVNEPEDATTSQIVGLSPGVVVIAHPGDEVRPAVVVTDPGAALFTVADQRYLVRYAALDPDGSGRVSLEAYRDGSADVLALASDLPAAMDGSYEWDTSSVPNGPWVVRAKIVDARGYSFTAYARYFLTISHARLPPPEEEGCACRSARTGGSLGASLLLVLLLSARAIMSGWRASR